MNIRYVQIEPAVYDMEMARLAPGGRAVYGCLTVHLLANDGWIKDDIGVVAEVCGMDQLQASAGFELCKHLYVRRNGKIFSRNIRSVIAQAKKRAQANRIRAVTAAEVKYSEHAPSMLQADGKGKGKIPSLSPGNKNISPIPTLTRARQISAILKTKPSDWPSIINFVNSFKGNWDEVVNIANRAAGKRHPVSYFFAVVRREMDYRRSTRGGLSSIGDTVKNILKGVQSA